MELSPQMAAARRAVAGQPLQPRTKQFSKLKPKTGKCLVVISDRSNGHTMDFQEFCMTVQRVHVSTEANWRVFRSHPACPIPSFECLELVATWNRINEDEVRNR